MRWLGPTTLVVLTMTLAACADKKEEKREDLEAFAQTALGDDKAKDKAAKEADAKAAAERKKAFDERKKKEEAEKAKLDAIAEQVVKGRDKLPKNLDAACTELIENYSDWVKAVYFDQDEYQLTFFDSRKKNLGKIMGNCAKLGSIEATTCMVEVIEAVSAEDFPEADRKLIQGQPDYLFEACVDKFAPGK